jgi:hypothetical protein
MSDWLVLGLLAIGFYVYECCTWTPAPVFACYRRPFRKRWAGAAGAELPGNESGGFAFSDPLTLSGNIVHCSDWPVAVSPDGFCIDAADTAEFWTFESIRSIASRERTIRINGEDAFSAASEMLALDLSTHLERFRVTPPRKRADAIRAALGQSFDPAMLRADWSRFQQSTRALTILAALPLAWLAVITPLALILFGPLSAWPYLLGGLLLSGLTVSVEFVRVHRKELHNVSDRWLHAISMTLFPIAAARAVDRISKERIAHFNPLAVAAVFCDEADGDPTLRRFAFDLVQSLTAETDSPASTCRHWYRAQKQSALKGLLTALKREPFTPPERIDPTMAVFCPRCHGQFAEGTEECSDCDAVRLERLADATV